MEQLNHDLAWKIDKIEEDEAYTHHIETTTTMGNSFWVIITLHVTSTLIEVKEKKTFETQIKGFHLEPNFKPIPKFEDED